MMLRELLCAGIVAALFAGGVVGQSSPAPGPFALVTTIGLDDGPAPYLFGQVRDIEVGPNGEVAVLDFMAGEVRVFGRDGRHRVTVGGFGGGPGEFVMPLSLIGGESSFFVVDPQSGKETGFSWSGELREEAPLPGPPNTPTSFRTPLAGGVLAIGMTMWSSRGPLPSMIPELVLFYPTPVSRMDTLVAYHAGGMPWRAVRGSGGIEGFHEPGGAWAVTDDSTVVTVDGWAGRVTWWSVGADESVAVRTVDTGIVPDELTAADRDRIVRRFRATRASDPQLGQYVTGEIETASPSRWSGVKRVLSTSSETLWLEIGGGRAGYFDEAPETRWVAFDPATEISVDIELPEGFEPMRVVGDRLYGVNQTALGSDVVEVYTTSSGGARQ